MALTFMKAEKSGLNMKNVMSEAYTEIFKFEVFYDNLSSIDLTRLILWISLPFSCHDYIKKRVHVEPCLE